MQTIMELLQSHGTRPATADQKPPDLYTLALQKERCLLGMPIATLRAQRLQLLRTLPSLQGTPTLDLIGSHADQVLTSTQAELTAIARVLLFRE